jgi:hypothetical protein
MGERNANRALVGNPEGKTSLEIFRISGTIILGWAGHEAHMGEPINAYRVLVGKKQGKRPVGRSKCQ